MKDNFKYKIGVDLREKPHDKKLFKKGILILEKEALNTKKSIEKVKILSKIGVLYRILGELDKSQQRLDEASILIKELGNKKLWIINNIRIAQTLQFKNKNQQAELLYQKLVKEIEDGSQNHELLSFIYQHRGKNYFEQGKLKAALREVEKALEKRKQDNNVELIASSEYARKIIKNKISKK